MISYVWVRGRPFWGRCVSLLSSDPKILYPKIMKYCTPNSILGSRGGGAAPAAEGADFQPTKHAGWTPEDLATERQQFHIPALLQAEAVRRDEARRAQCEVLAGASWAAGGGVASMMT